jgi:hypothetical protein
VDASLLRILDAAIEAGGRDLTGRAIAGAGRPAADALKKLCDSGHLLLQGRKYTLTTEGRSIWETESSPERVRKVKADEERKQAEAISSFLTVVEDKGESALRNPEVTRHSAAIERAVEQGLVAKGSRANAFILLPAGKLILISSAPLDQQLARLRGLGEEVETRQSAVLVRLGQSQSDFNGEGPDQLSEVLTELKQQATQAQVAYANLLTELTAFSRLHAVAGQMREAILSKGEPLMRRIEEESARLREREQQLQEAIEQQRRERETFKEQLAARLAALAAEAAPVVAKPSAVTPPPPAKPDQATVWRATQQAYAELRRASVIVKIPELFDKVRATESGITLEDYHNLLKGWQRADRLVLQICNDPHVEPRAGEGIRLDRGLLFYIQLI